MAAAEVVGFDSRGVRCRGWLYRPDRSEGDLPAVVISHGLSGTHGLHYWRVAETFADAGFIAFDFDPRFVGASDGVPKQRWSPAGLRQDLQAAVGYLRTVPGVDPEKVILYGSSTGGGAAIEVASQDHRVAALVCVVPHVDGLTDFPGLSMGRKLALVKDGVRDLVARALGRDQVTIPAFGADSSGVGAVDRDGAAATVELEVEPGGTWNHNHTAYVTGDSVWANAVAPFDLLLWLAYRPGRNLARVTCPTLVVSGDHDTVTPPGPQRKLAGRNQRVELLTGPWNHFDVFRADRGFPEVAKRMVGFMESALA